MIALTLPDNAGFFRQRAADMVKMAAQASTAGAKDTYLSMALGYVQLARMVARREGKSGH